MTTWTTFACSLAAPSPAHCFSLVATNVVGVASRRVVSHRIASHHIAAPPSCPLGVAHALSCLTHVWYAGAACVNRTAKLLELVNDNSESQAALARFMMPGDVDSSATSVAKVFCLRLNNIVVRVYGGLRLKCRGLHALTRVLHVVGWDRRYAHGCMTC